MCEEGEENKLNKIFKFNKPRKLPVELWVFIQFIILPSLGDTHTENLLRILDDLTWIRLYLLFSDWFEIKLRFVCVLNQSENGKYNLISVSFNKNFGKVSQCVPLIVSFDFNPLMPVGNYSCQFFICCPRDCVSRTANVEHTVRH